MPEHSTPAQKRRGLQSRAQIEGRDRARKRREQERPLRELVKQHEREAFQAWLRETLRPERLQNRRRDIFLGRDPLRLVIDNTGRR